MRSAGLARHTGRVPVRLMIVDDHPDVRYLMRAAVALELVEAIGGGAGRASTPAG